MSAPKLTWVRTVFEDETWEKEYVATTNLGTYVVAVVPSSLYEGRNDGWTVKFYGPGCFGHQDCNKVQESLGSVDFRQGWGKGEKKYWDARRVAENHYAALVSNSTN